MTPTLLRATAITKHLGARVVSDAFSFTAPVGTTWVRGPNGSGKTTLLECLAGIEALDGGSIALDGLSLARSRNDYLVRVFYVPNRLELHPRVTIGDFAALVRRGKGDIDPDAVAACAAALGLFAAPDRAVSTLSFGTQKKLMLSFALVCDCPVSLFDEPTEGLDAAAVAAFEQRMHPHDDRIRIVASHDAECMRRCEPHVVDLP